MIAVVIPCYQVKKHIMGVLNRFDDLVDKIYIIDDACPENTGKYVSEHCTDTRVKVLTLDVNKGVGGATIQGIHAALEDSADIIIKVDGDGQINPEMIKDLIKPILSSEADYVKGNRFYYPEMLKQMPRVRLLGNSVLSFMSKFSTGYWSSMDPTNGFFAINSCIAKEINWNHISNRFFFESDILFHLSLSKAVVKNFPMAAIYGDEISNLSIKSAALTFPFLHANRFVKRTYYNYFLRDFNACSLMLVMATLLLPFGFTFGTYKWYQSIITGNLTSTGTVMISVLPIVLGFQSFLSFIQLDISNEPIMPRKNDVLNSEKQIRILKN